jgi:hypothetical protein
VFAGSFRSGVYHGPRRPPHVNQRVGNWRCADRAALRGTRRREASPRSGIGLRPLTILEWIEWMQLEASHQRRRARSIIRSYEARAELRVATAAASGPN